MIPSGSGYKIHPPIVVAYPKPDEDKGYRKVTIHTMEFFFISLLNGLSYGLLLFMLSSGFTLIFSMMGVLNFAHASFYMLGAYIGYSVSQWLGFWVALVVSPLLVGLFGALFEGICLRRVHRFGHIPELLVTFGLSYVITELVQLVWGRIPLEFRPPEILQGAALTLIQHPTEGLQWVWGNASAEMCQSSIVTTGNCTSFPATRGFSMVISMGMLLGIWVLLEYTRIGLIIRAALTHPQMVQALGYNVPSIFTLVFSTGAMLAGLAGVIGGSTFVTEPHMATALGPIIFVVVVVGGMGSLKGAFLASLLIGLLQTWGTSFNPLAKIAPVLPYLLLILTLIIRPNGLLGGYKN